MNGCIEGYRYSSMQFLAVPAEIGQPCVGRA
jgi:hypothetical protein